MSEQDKQEIFEYLDALKKSGVTDMFGVGHYVLREFGLNHTKKEVSKVFLEWIKNSVNN